MAKRNRYREMESLMTRVIIGDALVFALYLLCAGLGWTVLKVTTAIIAILGSLLCLGWLVITGEFSRRRSLWMVRASSRSFCACWCPCFLAIPALRLRCNLRVDRRGMCLDGTYPFILLCICQFAFMPIGS